MKRRTSSINISSRTAGQFSSRKVDVEFYEEGSIDIFVKKQLDSCEIISHALCLVLSDDKKTLTVDWGDLIPKPEGCPDTIPNEDKYISKLFKFIAKPLEDFKG